MGRTKSHVRNSVRELRFKNGEMTQQELAKRIGVARQTIIAIEQGRFCPSLESALRMARVFSVSVDEIFTLEEPEPTVTTKGRRGKPGDAEESGT